MNLESGEIPTLLTKRLWPSKTFTWRPESNSQILTELSKLPETKNLLFSDTASEDTLLECP
eukprot:CAMPEP_0202427602 /NCGR_PEP_ID=MMETSP1345-20130828/1789_1 /ASSEMBLY_ACC=CAM_ASM_000843 /TAXON_ID=342563 /ORGANISM="Fabrea Fabrea salina" /LENGTH=60 /DNA_ID=CAMNT_0049038361 /DNA_START=698 /DNA_END=880 /DNA_ORIENTATION=-